MRSQEYLLLSAVSRVMSTVVPVPSGRHGRRRKRIFSGTAGRRRKSEPATTAAAPALRASGRVTDTKMGGGISTTVQFSVSAEASNSSVSLINNWHLSVLILLFSPLSHWAVTGRRGSHRLGSRPSPARPPTARRGESY